MRLPILIALRDMQWSRRRFGVAVVATSLVFALSLLMSGVSSSFENEIGRTVDSFRADAWVVRAQSFGPFTGPATIPESRADAVRRMPGVLRASPVAVLRATTRTPTRRSVNLVGVVPGGVGSPPGRDGHLLERSGAAIVDASLGLGVGAPVDLDGRSFRVAGITHGHTYFAGIPTVTVSLAAAQDVGLGGRPLATAVVTTGRPTRMPASLSVLANADVRRDLERPVAQAKQTISLIRLLLWLVAGGIIGAIVYLSVLERVRDFATMKAVGVSNLHLGAGLVLEAVVLSLLAAALAAVLERLIAPAVSMSVEVSAVTFGALPVVAITAGVLASALGLRRAVATDPTIAFASAR